MSQLQDNSAGVPLSGRPGSAARRSGPGRGPDLEAAGLFDAFCRRLCQGEEASAEDPADLGPRDGVDKTFLYSQEPPSAGRSGEGQPSSPALPARDDELFGFRLCRELGRGAFARVFLAEQADLAGRQVVLKVSRMEGNEPQTLALLQHTHIVPIYSLHEDPRAGLRAVCMPYFGGASLHRVLQALHEGGQRPTRGDQLVRALQAVGGPPPTPWGVGRGAWGVESGLAAEPSGETGGPHPAGTSSRPTPHSPRPTHMPAGLSYPRAVAWVVARLAEGLQHAHQRGVLHRDVKPSNILLAADGQPLLLDFNLAQDTRAGRDPVTLGGTVAYMAPEHLRALASAEPGRDAPIDQRSDVYSLGMVLYEMLAGQSPFEQKASYFPLSVVIEAMARERSQTVPSLRRGRPDVPWGLESITRKCLAPDPAQRYQQAEHLAEDLRRFLDDRPLKYAPELSRKERVGKWLRRHPRLTSSGAILTVAAVLLLAVGAALVGVRGQLEGARDRDRQRAFEAGTVRALCLVNTTTDLPDHLRQGTAVCEETLALFGVLDRPDWQADPAWRRLDPDGRNRLAEDAQELLLLLAWARVRTQPGDPAVLREALALLDRAEAVEGVRPSPALELARAHYLDQLGESGPARTARERAGAMEPASARDHYLLAVTFAHRGGPDDYAQAVAALDRALRLNPRHYWALVQRGLCRQEQGEYTLAVADFSTCIGLWPEFAWAHFNRGCALARAGRKAEAVADYSAALERDPEFVPAHLNRGLTQLELKEYEPALANFDRAAELGRDDAALHAGRGVALEGLGRAAEADAAFAAAFDRLPASPAEVQRRVRWVYGFAVSARLPDRAREAFEEVLRQDPDHAQALYGRAMLLAERDDLAEALGALDRAVAADPGFVEARRGRAVLLARAGRLEQARQEINWCLGQGPAAGATLYAAACVSSRIAEQSADPRTAAQALDFLRRAFASGYGRDRAGHDPDLAGLRRQAEFQRLLADSADRSG